MVARGTPTSEMGAGGHAPQPERGLGVTHPISRRPRRGRCERRGQWGAEQRGRGPERGNGDGGRGNGDGGRGNGEARSAGSGDGGARERWGPGESGVLTLIGTLDPPAGRETYRRGSIPGKRAVECTRATAGTVVPRSARLNPWIAPRPRAEPGRPGGSGGG